MDKISVQDVFKIQGQPTITYIKRQNGYYEKKLSEALDSKGSLCLLTGPSKTGKTTLYTQVANDKKLQVLQVRCHQGLSVTELWRKALEAINFDRINENQKQREISSAGEGKISGKIGWSWLANLTGEGSVNISRSKSETEIRNRILSDPSPEHLIPVLSLLPIILVVEDFHYLTPDTQKQIFQQWKIFVDKEVSVIVVGTTHHAADLAHANKDLFGRTIQIDLAIWDKNDLKQIALRGFTFFKIPISDSVMEVIAQESVGVPIITQSVCLALCMNCNIRFSGDPSSNTEISNKDAYKALHQVAAERYSVFSAIYDRLARGPRKKARKYDTYQLILSTFTLDPVVFSLKREEIGERLKRLQIQTIEIPPQGSVSSTLRVLGTFQKKLGIELLDWSEKDQRIYIIEPTFLFYLRWRKARQDSPKILEVFQEFLSILRN